MSRRRRVGAALLIVGGLADVPQVLAVQFAPQLLSGPELAVAVGFLTSPLLIAIGCIVLSTSYRGRGRLGFLIAGAFSVLLVAVNASQMALASPFGPAPSQLATVLSWAATLAGAALLLSDHTLSGPARWAFAIPGGCILLLVLGVFFLPWGGTFILPPLGYVVAGYLLLRTAPDTASTATRRKEDQQLANRVL